jgi:hypothetical protein
MTPSESPATTETLRACFPSLAALKAAHIALLERRRLSDNAEAFLGELAAFIRRGSATGVLLDTDDERYWRAVGY